MSDFGIDASRVYANDSLTGNPAFWSVLPGGTDGNIADAVLQSGGVKSAIQAKLHAPGDPNARTHVVDVCNRATTACLGQTILKQPLNADDQTVSLYHILQGGTAGAIDDILNAPVNSALHDAFGKQDANAIVQILTRQTGRGLFEACLTQVLKTAGDPASLAQDVLGAVTGELKRVLNL